MISQHALELELLRVLLQVAFSGARIRMFRSIQEWEASETTKEHNEAVLYNIDDAQLAARDVRRDLKDFIARAGNRRVIVLSRSDDLMATCAAIDCGAASYIPPSAGIEELISALRGSSSTSVVLPRRSMLAMCAAINEALHERPGLDSFFTDRQLDVARALQRGAANKTIAYELGLCESTVKVHVRNIMRKLKATNRTQAASRLNDLANGTSVLEDESPGT